MVVAPLISKPGITNASTLSIPKTWSASWFASFISSQLTGADVRNALGVDGISVSGNLTSPYATIGLTAGYGTEGYVYTAQGPNVNPIWAPAAGGSSLTVTDGTNTVTGTTKITVSGATVGGSTPDATITISGGSLTVTDGTNTVTGTTSITFSGATVSGSTPDATVTISGGGGTTLAAAILADSPFAFWKCSDASGGFADSSGNGYNLTTTDGTINYASSYLVPTLPTTAFANIGGRAGAASTSGAALTSNLGLTLPITNWSVEAVVKPLLTAGNTRIFDMRAPGAGTAAMTLFLVAGTAFEAFYPGSSNSLSATWTPINESVHVVFTCSTTGTTSTLSWYINGDLISSTTQTASTLTGTMVSQIGSTNALGTTAPFNIAYVALYSKALSATRIAAHAAAAGKLGM